MAAWACLDCSRAGVLEGLAPLMVEGQNGARWGPLGAVSQAWEDQWACGEPCLRDRVTPLSSPRCQRVCIRGRRKRTRGYFWLLFASPQFLFQRLIGFVCFASGLSEGAGPPLGEVP